MSFSFEYLISTPVPLWYPDDFVLKQNNCRFQQNKIATVTMITIRTRHTATKTQSQFSLHQLEASGSFIVGCNEVDGSSVETSVTGLVGSDLWVVRVTGFVVIVFVVDDWVVDVVGGGVIILAPQSFPQYSWHRWPLYPVPSQSQL